MYDAYKVSNTYICHHGQPNQKLQHTEKCNESFFSEPSFSYGWKSVNKGSDQTFHTHKLEQKCTPCFKDEIVIINYSKAQITYLRNHP